MIILRQDGHRSLAAANFPKAQVHAFSLPARDGVALAILQTVDQLVSLESANQKDPYSPPFEGAVQLLSSCLHINGSASDTAETFRASQRVVTIQPTPCTQQVFCIS